MSTIFYVMLISMGVIAILMLAATVVWVIFFKLIKGITGNVKDTVRTIKEPSRKIKEIRTSWTDKDGVVHESVEVIK